jgi:hypothetical protein
LRAGNRSGAHLPRWETRRLIETADIPARIAELRSVLLDTRSDDLREVIQAAIKDCQRRLAELEQSSSSQQPSSQAEG